MKKTSKTITASCIQELPFPRVAIENDSAVDMIQIFKHKDVHVRESGSLSLSTLLINKQNIAAFQRNRSIAVIIESLLPITPDSESLSHIRMSISSLTLLTENNAACQQQLLQHPHGIRCLFIHSQLLIHHDPELQQICFRILHNLSKLDNAMPRFIQANIKDYLVSSELLVDANVSKQVSRRASELLCQLLLFKGDFCSISDIERICFQAIEQGEISIHDEQTEKNVFHAVHYLLSCGMNSTSSAMKVLLYCLQIIQNQRIADLSHLLLLLKCILECIRIDAKHCDYAINNRLFASLLYCSHYRFWFIWLKESVRKESLIATLEMNATSFSFPFDPSPRIHQLMQDHIYPKFTEVLDMLVDTYLAVIETYPALIIPILTSGVIPSILESPSYRDPVLKQVYPTVAVTRLLANTLLTALLHHDTNQASPQHLPLVQSLLVSNRQCTSILMPNLYGISQHLASTGKDLSLILRLLEVNDLITLLFDNIHAMNSIDRDLYEIIAGVAIIYQFGHRELVYEDFILDCASTALRRKKLFAPCIALICTVREVNKHLTQFSPVLINTP